MQAEVKNLPEYFRPILWSYDFFKVDPYQDRIIIIVNSINYGDLRHWRWIRSFYGKSEVAKILQNVPVTELRGRVIRLTALLFGINKWNYAPRSLNR